MLFYTPNHAISHALLCIYIHTLTHLLSHSARFACGCCAPFPALRLLKPCSALFTIFLAVRSFPTGQNIDSYIWTFDSRLSSVKPLQGPVTSVYASPFLAFVRSIRRSKSIQSLRYCLHTYCQPACWSKLARGPHRPLCSLQSLDCDVTGRPLQLRYPFNHLKQLYEPCMQASLIVGQCFLLCSRT